MRIKILTLFATIFFLSQSSFAFETFDLNALTPRWLKLDDALFGTDFDEIHDTALIKVNPNTLPSNLLDGNIDDFRLAVERQLVRCKQLDQERKWLFGERLLSRLEWCTKTNEKFLELIDQSDNFEQLMEYASEEFDWYQSIGKEKDRKVKFTGYYIPLLFGRRTPSRHFSYPIYKKPNDLKRVTEDGKRVWRRVDKDGSYHRYYTREEIDWGGALEEQNLEIVWVSDMIESYFLHIQGSGQVDVIEEDGTAHRININYAAGNGRPWRSVARKMIEEGVPREYLTLQGLRRYFEERPHEVDRLFPYDESYVFFNEQDKGPFGSGSTVLVPGHSIATDNSIFPLGAVSMFSTQRPIVENDRIVDWKHFSRLAVNQDTGGAIRSASRVDVFWGSGQYAEWAAGNLSHQGTLYFAVVKEKK